MPIDWHPLVDAVRRHQRFLLTTHVRPDGDGLGSIKALAAALGSLKKEVRILIPGRLPPRYQFLDPEGWFESYQAPNGRAPGEVRSAADGAWPEVILILDTGTWNQLADMAELVRNSPALKFVIDHHVTQDDLGAVRLVDTRAEATGRLAFEAIEALGIELPEESASAIFVALAMDTGWFRHSNSTAWTFELAARLVAAGAKPHLLYQQLFEQNTLARLRLTGRVLSRLTITAGGKVAYSEIRGADYAETGAIPPDTEDLVNYTMNVAGVEVGLLFMEQPQGGVKVSFRSRGTVNVARLAERFDGGGHPVAAGATLDSPLAKAQQRILDAVEAALSWSV